MRSPHHGHVASWPSSGKVPRTSSSSSRILEVRQPEGQRDNWECYSPRRTDTMLQWCPVKEEPHLSTSWATSLGHQLGPWEKNTRSLGCFPWTSCCPHATKAGTLRSHQCKSVHMFPPSHSESSFLSLQRKKSPFCLTIHNFTQVASFPHLTRVCLGMRQVWVWQRNQLIPSSSSTNSEWSKII